MGKSYVENSLKRFLKRKVKITLGVVVTFLITGAVSFGADETIKIDEYHQKYNLDGILTAKDNLTGLGNGVISAGENNQYVEIEKTADKTIIKKAEDKSVIAEIDNSLISSKTAETVSTALQGMDGTSAETGEGNNKTLSNNGISETEQLASQTILSLVNNGIIKTTGSLKGQHYGTGRDGMTFINNGVIDSGNRGQSIYGGTNVKLENNGIIISGTDGQIITGQGIIINNGIIKNKAGQGQEVTSNNSTAINYGMIESANIGQRASGTSDSILKNYGEIKVSGNNSVGQSSSTAQNKALNYGIISSNGNNATGQSGTGIYNYGLISSEVIGMNGTGYNYGVIKVVDVSKAFSGDVTNKGIVIADSGELAPKYNTGILLDSEYNVRGEDTKVFKSGETVESFGEKNTFGESITKGYVKNASVNIDNTQGKVIGTVVTEKLDKAVFNYSGDDLFLKDTTITGYFEKDGTLLDVGTGNLTLGGDTNITAVKNNFDLDVTAVQLGENGKITIMDEAKINGLIKGNENSEITFTQSKGEYKVDGGKVAVNIGKADPNGSKYQQYFDITLNGATSGVTDSKVSEIEISTENGVKDLTNKLVIGKDLTVGKNADGNSIYDTNKTNDKSELELTIENIHNIEGNILLGAGKDTVIVTNNDNHVTEHLKTEINLGTGEEDKFVVVGNAVDDKGESKNIFSYNVVNAETIELQGGTWGDWNEAEGTIKFTDSTKAGKQPNFVLGNNTTMNITLNAEGNHGSDFANYVGTKLGLDHAVITGTGNGSVVKYLIDEKGLDTANLSTKKYSFGDGVSYKDSPIFNISSTKEDGVNISVKTAGEMGLSGQDRIIYDAYIDQIKVGTANKDVINQINGYNTSEDFAGLIKNTSVTGEAYYTAGSVVTMDIADTYLSGVEDFTKRAGKGEWLAQGKYINSDTEFDGGSKVKGYDGDVTGTVGMIEYGFTENTSYGVVYGQGDSEMDIDGGGKLDGDNIYAGLYMKHRTQNGIELVANLGYVENEMDSVLRNDFKFDNLKFDNGISSNGKTFEKGTADSSAVILSVKGKKDYRITDTVKVQPILGARATFINQEEAENPEMHFTIKEQDIIVVEGTAGMGIAKEFALSQGKLELNAGVEYTFAATSSTNDAEYTLFDKTTVKLEDVDTAENTGTAFAGFDYEHESGVGFNGKYEMMWSDKGDDSRITAGISYRF